VTDKQSTNRLIHDDIPVTHSETDSVNKPPDIPISVRIRQKRRSSSLAMSLNLTPMIDIVFLLLFFFLTVSRFQAAEGMLPAQLPAQKSATAALIPRTPIRIRFLANPNQSDMCKVTIDRFNESPLSISILSGALTKIRNDAPGFDRDTPVHLLAGDDIPWDHVVNAYNAAMAAGYEKIFFAGSQ